jgi:hypothetical protein
MLDELGGPNTYNHYTNGWAMAFNTPFQDVEALRLQRRQLRSLHHLLAEGDQGQGRGSPAVPPRDRNYIVGAWGDIPAQRASGVPFAQGSYFGGHTLYVEDNRLHYVYNFVGMIEQQIVATEHIPRGENLILSASFLKDGGDPPSVSTGMWSLFHGEDKVGEERIKTQPSAFGLAGTDLTVGRAISRITDDYPASVPGASPAARSRRLRSMSAASRTSTSSAPQPR